MGEGEPSAELLQLVRRFIESLGTRATDDLIAAVIALPTREQRIAFIEQTKARRWEEARRTKPVFKETSRQRKAREKKQEEYRQDCLKRAADAWKELEEIASAKAADRSSRREAASTIVGLLDGVRSLRKLWQEAKQPPEVWHLSMCLLRDLNEDAAILDAAVPNNTLPIPDDVMLASEAALPWKFDEFLRGEFQRFHAALFAIERKAVLIRDSQPPQATAAANPSKVTTKATKALPPHAPPEPYVFSQDFRSGTWFGVEYSFTAQQAAAVRVLLAAFENGTPEVGGDTICLAIDEESPPNKLADVFRAKGKFHPAWNVMIVAGGTKGSYRLAAPENL